MRLVIAMMTMFVEKFGCSKLSQSRQIDVVARVEHQAVRSSIGRLQFD
jgi:hypothetical protein